LQQESNNRFHGKIGVEKWKTEANQVGAIMQSAISWQPFP
jgi:hypothetical protein